MYTHYCLVSTPVNGPSVFPKNRYTRSSVLRGKVVDGCFVETRRGLLGVVTRFTGLLRVLHRSFPHLLFFPECRQLVDPNDTFPSLLHFPLLPSSFFT